MAEIHRFLKWRILIIGCHLKVYDENWKTDLCCCWMEMKFQTPNESKNI